MSSSFGKILLGLLLIAVIGACALFLYNKYAETYGDPTWQEAFKNATSLAYKNNALAAQNVNLTSQVDNLTAQNEFLAAQYPGVDSKYFYAAIAVLLFLFLLAYSLQAKKGDINMSIEQFRKIAIPYAYNSFSILPSSGLVWLQEYLPHHLRDITRHPIHLTCARYWEETVVIEGRLSTKYFIGCFTQGTVFGYKREITEKTVRIAICSNDPNDISAYPAMTLEQVSKILEKKVKARNGIISGASESELVTTLGQKVLTQAAAQTAQEEV